MKKKLSILLILVLLVSTLPIANAAAASYSSPILFAQKEYGALAKKDNDLSDSKDYILIDISSEFLFGNNLMISCSWKGQGYALFVPFDEVLLCATDLVGDYDWDFGLFTAQGSSEEFTFGLRDSKNTRFEVSTLIYMLYLYSL